MSIDENAPDAAFMYAVRTFIDLCVRAVDFNYSPSAQRELSQACMRLKAFLAIVEGKELR